MPDFNEYLARHGETGIQALIELIERREGIRNRAYISLEERWNALMQVSPIPQSMAA